MLYNEDDPVVREMKEMLHKRAVGYEVEEVYKTMNTDGSFVVTTRKRHIPGDSKAMVDYMRLFADKGDWS